MTNKRRILNKLWLYVKTAERSVKLHTLQTRKLTKLQKAAKLTLYTSVIYM